MGVGKVRVAVACFGIKLLKQFALETRKERERVRESAREGKESRGTFWQGTRHILLYFRFDQTTLKLISHILTTAELWGYVDDPLPLSNLHRSCRNNGITAPKGGS